ncbi:MAG: sugar phosphate nucleotidyltransferase [bacterium]|nr:sugar phosphate nucleotidyltransferase [bacterium]
MQAVILAAGLGTRMRPLTNTVAKPLLKIGKRALLDYTFDALPDEVDEVIVVIGYLGEQIKSHLGESFRGRNIKYVVQEKLEGTAKALFEAKPLLKGKFLVLMADDIYVHEDIRKCLKHDYAILVMRSTEEGPGGKVKLDEKNQLVSVEEGKAHPAGTLISTNVFVLTPEIFTYEPVKLTDREGEWGLPQTVVELSKDYSVAVVEATRWIKITTPEDLELAEKLLV